MTTYKAGDRVFVDKRYEAQVREVWPEGSTSYAFPHAKIIYVDIDYHDPHIVALSRISVSRS